MASESSPSRRRVLQLAGVGSVGLLAGCVGGGDDDDDDNGETPTPGGNGDPGPVEPTGSMLYTSNVLLPNIDPALPAGIPTTISDINFYDPLVFPNSDWERESLVAETWDVSEDGMTFTFTIRDDIEFQSGNPLTAEDVAYSMERQAAIGVGAHGFLGGLLESAEALDDHTIELIIEEPYSVLVDHMDRLYVIDSEIAQEEEVDGDWSRGFLADNEAGSGPYTLGEWVDGDHIIFEFHPDHWEGWQENNFATFRWEEIPEMSTRMQMMITGESDMSSVTFEQDMFNQMDEHPEVRVTSNPTPSMYLGHMNTQRMPTDDIHVRRMIAHAMDYETVITSVFEDPIESHAAGLIPNTLPEYNDDLQPYEFDLDKAKEELDNSVYSLEEINDSLDGMYPTGNPSRPILILADGLREIDVELPIRDISWVATTEAAQRVEDTPSVTTLRIGSNIARADDLLYEAHHPDRAGTYVSMNHFFEDELTDIIEEGRRTIDEQARTQLYHEAQEIIHEAYPAVYINSATERLPIREDIGGFEYRGSMAMHYRLNRLYRRN